MNTTRKIILPLSLKELKKSKCIKTIALAKRIEPLNSGKPSNINPNTGKNFGSGVKYYQYQVKEKTVEEKMEEHGIGLEDMVNDAVGTTSGYY